jgi:aminopeptidase N
MEFAGAITRPMNGIYPCFFEHDGQEKKLIATQFESHHAREAFPCIDEPEAKASFALTLTTPVCKAVISNTPVKTQEMADGRLVTSFEETPRMSTYLLAFAFGEMGYTEGRTKDGVVVRSYATPDNVKLTHYSVDVAVRCLEFFTEYFATQYPLKKLDMAALPDFSAGAMENWGLVTYRETTMLADPKNTSIESKQLVALVICHELSHQWFGNLVTMKWWNDLWLNESFANMMEYRAVDALFPEWNIWEQFVATESAAAKRRDSLTDVQPIRIDVNHPDEISTIFDPSIVYAKGGTVLRMLLSYVGEADFQKGLRAYFKKHAYANTEGADLWNAIAEASSKDIGEFMAGWLNQPGYPLVETEWSPGQDSVKLSQRRFLSESNASDKTNSLWQVPIAVDQPAEPALLCNAAGEVTLSEPDRTPILNHDGVSYFIPRYTNADHLKQIVSNISGGTVSSIDRSLLLDNYVMMQRSGDSQTTELLNLLSAYSQETNENVWGNIATALAETRKLVEGDDAPEARLDKLIEKLVMPTVERLGWDDLPDDSAQTLRLRGLAIALAVGGKVEVVLDEARRRLTAFKQPSDLSPTIRSVIYVVGAKYGSDADFKKLLKLHNQCQNADERDELASGLTSAKQPQHVKELIRMLTGDHIRRQDVTHWFAWLLRNRYSRAEAWDWLTSHWDWVVQEFSSDKSYSYFARYPGSVFSRAEELKKYEAFFGEKKKIVAMKRDIALGEAEISSRIAWRERNEAAVKTWLMEQT